MPERQDHKMKELFMTNILLHVFEITMGVIAAQIFTKLGTKLVDVIIVSWK